MDVPKEAWDRIARLIEAADSPVGIDARKTHIMILHKLEEIERRLDSLERMVSAPPRGDVPL